MALTGRKKTIGHKATDRSLDRIKVQVHDARTVVPRVVKAGSKRPKARLV